MQFTYSIHDDKLHENRNKTAAYVFRFLRYYTIKPASVSNAGFIYRQRDR